MNTATKKKLHYLLIGLLILLLISLIALLLAYAMTPDVSGFKN